MDKTPPHAPTWRVDISDENIAKLMRLCILKPWTTLDISRLSNKESYNNRIYIVRCYDSNELVESCVLKVNGRFFGPAKIENEISCLLLLKHFCPSLPVPRALAWSEDGLRLTRQDDNGKLVSALVDDALQQTKLPGWILMTLLPGSPIDASNLPLSDMKHFSSQLARIVATWRQRMPDSDNAANIHFKPRTAASGTSDRYQAGPIVGLEFHIYGFVGSGRDCDPCAHSHLGYWQTELDWQLSQLSTNPTYAINREPLLSDLQEFMKSTLPNLFMFTLPSSSKFVFTHTDLFPRNVLVHGSPPEITGIVDFEFSGFFPPMEEFLQEWLPEDDGSQWPPAIYDMMLEELEKFGETTPCSLSPTQKTETMLLNVIRNFIAPWWLATSGDEEEHAEELLQARQQVLNGLGELSRLTRS